MANEAVGLNPKLGWVYPQVLSALREDGHHTAEMKDVLAKLEAWDSNNAFPYLLEGEELMEERRGKFFSRPKFEEVEKDTAWREVMEKAFVAPRYDSYISREFDFDRTWLKEHDMADPGKMILLAAWYPIPNLLNIRVYADFLNKELGKGAEQAGKFPEATGYYWIVAHFSERMHLYDGSSIEKLVAIALQREAYNALVPLLRKAGRADEAAALEYANKEMVQWLKSSSGKDPFAQSAIYTWSSLMVTFFAMLVVAFGLVTAICVVYVNAKQWVRPEVKGRLYQSLTVAENYMPVLLLAACAGLYFTYFPYAQNFRHYMAATGSIHNF